MKIAKNSKLLFIGDSITDCGRAMPVGEGRSDNDYGRGYVNLIRGLFAVDYVDNPVRIINMGISGNTVRDLKERWERDVLDMNPDWVSVMIGINDVCKQFVSPLEKEKHINLEEFRETLDELVAKTADKVSGMILLTPFFIEARKDDPIRKMTDEYCNAVKDIAEKYSTVFVDTQAAMDKLMNHINGAEITFERVHPDVKGHMAIAKAFMNAVK